MQNFDDEADAFAVLVMRHLSARGETDIEYEQDEFAIRTGDLILNLHNIFRETRELDDAERDARVARHFEALRDLQDPQQDWPSVRSALRPLLRPTASA
ncbi:hypothetical protein IU459_00485 [Nocardia amamiensis]|uniref:Uncharacterized protein n=1 Tax=Nocardia amamiensis TaxID=404578 RepID=A0ABS0CHC2_9NOCA|nr:hypothetical protein [Nocardia amamiensis]MBF6296018.1 hypothetical protein [Nocardia amamiensis]